MTCLAHAGRLVSLPGNDVSWPVLRACCWSLAGCPQGGNEDSTHPSHDRPQPVGHAAAGRHFRRKLVRENSPLLYHLDRCDEAMTQAFAKPAEQVERAPDLSRDRHSRH